MVFDLGSIPRIERKYFKENLIDNTFKENFIDNVFGVYFRLNNLVAI